MKRILFLLALLPSIVYCQSVLPLRADTVRIEKVGGSAELHLRNATRGTLGLLTNIGDGRTRFLVTHSSGDSLFVGKDTIIGARKVDSLWKDGDSVRFTINHTPYAILGGSTFTLYNALGGTGDTLVNADKEVKTLAAGDGILHSVTGTTITQKVDSSKYATIQNVNNPTPWPKETPYGTVYNKSTWSTNGDFTIVGDQAATVDAGTHKIKITSPGGAIAFANAVRIGKPSQLNQWSDTVDFKIRAWSGSDAFFGIGKKSISTHFATGYVGYMKVSSSGGGLTLAHEAGSAFYSTDAGVAINLNDSIRLIMTFNDSVLTFKAANLTLGTTSGTITLNFTTASDPFHPNTGTFSLWGFLNTVNSIEVQRISISSTEIRNPNVMGIGDSKADGLYAANHAQRFMMTLGATYPHMTLSAGGADELWSIIQRKEEILKLNPEYIIIEAGCNDIRYSTSLGKTKEYMDEIMSWFLKARAKPYIIVIPEDSTGGGVGLTLFKNWVASKYANNYIDVWTTMSTSNVLKAAYNSGDDVHPNAAGNAVIDSIIRASGKLATLNPNRRSAIRTTDDNIISIGDSAALPYAIERALNRILRVDSNYNIVGSNIYDDGYKITVTKGNADAVQNTAGTGALMRVNGTLAFTGNEGGFVFYDRTNSSNLYGFYSDNNIIRLLYNGAIQMKTNSEGRFKIANDLENINIPSIINLKRSYSYAVPQGVIGLSFSIDTATTTYTGGISTPGDGAISSIAPQTIVSTGTTPTFPNFSSFYIDGAPIAGSGTTITNPWAVYIKAGKFRIGTTDSTGTPTGGYLFKDFGTGEIKLGPGGSSSGSSSNYVPTITGISNMSSTTLTKAHYYRSGSHLQVYVYLSIDPTTVGTTEIAISLPASSELAAGDLFGVGNCSIAAQSGIVTTDATNNRATFIYTATDTGSADFVLVFTYEEILP